MKWHWQGLVPGLNLLPFWNPAMKEFLNSEDSEKKNLGNFYKAAFGFSTADDEAFDQDYTKIVGEVSNQARSEYLADREHTEQREDTAYQRAVSDMRAAGLNPYTISASPHSSAVSSVGENSIQSKVQMLGYLLELRNLDAKNRSITNGLLGNVLKAIF